MITFKELYETYDMSVVDKDPQLKQKMMRALRADPDSREREQFDKLYGRAVARDPQARRKQRDMKRVDDRYKDKNSTVTTNSTMSDGQQGM